MNEILRLFILTVGLIFFFTSMMLLLRKKLNEKIALLWIVGIFSVLGLSIFPQLLNAISDDLGIDYPPSLLYLLAILVLFIYSLYQSIKIVEIQRQIKELSQFFALSQYKSPVNQITEMNSSTEKIEDV